MFLSLGECQVGIIPLYPLFSIPNFIRSPTTKLGLMLLHAKHPFHDGCFALPSFPVFPAQFSSNSRIDPCEQGKERGGWWEPGSVWIKQRGGTDGNGARFLRLRHPPNATVQTSQAPKQRCSRHRKGWEGVFSRKYKTGGWWETPSASCLGLFDLDC